MDFVLHSPSRLVAIAAKASERAHRVDARPLIELLGANLPGAVPPAGRLALVVSRGREIESLAAGVWAVTDWCLFGPAMM